MNLSIPNFLRIFKKKSSIVPNLAVRDKISRLEDAMVSAGAAQEDKVYELDGAGLKHTFSDAIYTREAVVPKGMLFTTKIHKTSHPYFMLKGKIRILTEEGVKVVTAPCHGVTPAGTKRLIYVLEDVVWCTCHATKSKDLRKIEKQTIAKDFGEFDFSEADKKRLLEE
jgi:hypothetical protein